MRTYIAITVFGILVSTACSHTPPAAAPVATASAESWGEEATLEAIQDSALASSNTSPALPAPPWAASRLRPNAAPEVVSAWREANNRSWCAPLAVSRVAGPQMQTRNTVLSGGWAVEYYAPSTATQGQANAKSCARCDRPQFGIAGTGMWVDEDAWVTEATPMWRDGSRAEYTDDAVEDAGGEGFVATIAIAGQGCVYQVWSYLGREHLAQLVADLRFIQTR